MESGNTFLDEQYIHGLIDTVAGEIRKVKADVVFGAANKQCNGLGICQVMTRGSMSNKSEKCRFASAEIWQQNKRLKMVFEANTLCDHLKNDLFDSPLFIMEDGFTIANSLASKLQITNTRIEAGIYPLYFEDDKFIIVFL